MGRSPVLSQRGCQRTASESRLAQDSADSTKASGRPARCQTRRGGCSAGGLARIPMIRIEARRGRRNRELPSQAPLRSRYLCRFLRQQNPPTLGAVRNSEKRRISATQSRNCTGDLCSVGFLSRTPTSMASHTSRKTVRQTGPESLTQPHGCTCAQSCPATRFSFITRERRKRLSAWLKQSLVQSPIQRKG